MKKTRRSIRRLSRAIRSGSIRARSSLSTRWPSLRIVIEIIFLLSLISMFEVELPNLLDLDSYHESEILLESITQVLASILGIVIAVLVVAFEISRSRYLSYASSSVFENRGLLDLLLLQATTVVAAIFFQTQLSQPISPTQVTLCHAIMYLFLLSIAMLFATCKNVLAGVDSRKHIFRIAQSLDPHNEESYPVRVGSKMLASPESPVLLLTRIVFNLVSSHDQASTRFLLATYSDRVDNFLANAEDKRRIIRAFIPLLASTARKAIDSRDEETVKYIIAATVAIHYRLAKEQAAWHHSIELDEALESITSSSMREGLEEASSCGLYALADIAKNHLQLNVPQEEDVWFIDEDPPPTGQIDHDKTNHWRALSTKYTAIIARVARGAIDTGRTYTAFAAFHSLCLMLERYHLQLPAKQRRDFVTNVFQVARHLQARAMRQGLSSEILSPFACVYLDGILRRNEEYAPQVLLQLAALVMETAKSDSLDRRLLEEIGAVGRGAARRLSSALDRETILFIAYTFDRLRLVLEDKSVEDVAFIYSEAHEQLISIDRWLREHHPEERKLARKLRGKVRKFSRMADTKAFLTSSLLHWPEAEKDEKGK